MRYLNVLWEMITNMLHHDFQARYGQPPEIITLDQHQGGLKPHDGFEDIDEVHHIMTHLIEHKITSHRIYPDDSSSDESESALIRIPVIDPLRYLQQRDEYSNAIIIESKIKLSDKIKQGTSKM